jgi:anhydro-N-acetylmuramic acid kinase
MSGTSADGVGAAIVDIGRDRRGGIARVTLLAHGTFAYAPALRRAVLDLFRPATGRVDDICHLNFALGEAFAAAVIGLAKRAGVPLGSIDLVGSHGQTIWHIPQGRRSGRGRIRSTLQIGEPAVIAERTGVTTVADFRPGDVAAGGQGAPLVPYADHVLFADRRRSRAVQNIGGIANVTYLPAGGGIGDILAFDTGPGNMIIDRVVCRATAGRRTYDKDGHMAAGGTVQPDLLARLMKHPYLRRRPPKTTGREEFGTQFTDALYDGARRRALAPKDVAATATMFTAASIADAYARFLPGPVDEVILCGGGARNATLVDMLRRELRRRMPRSPAVRLMDELGLNADAKEAVSFAILAAATIRGQAGNVPSATGASRPAVLGKIVPGR